MIIIIPVLCTLIFALIAFALMAKGRDHFFKVSLLLSAYGIVVFIILRNLLGNTSSHSAMDMMLVAITVLILSLVLAITFNILQLKLARKRIYATTLGTQIILLIVVSYLYFLSMSIVF